jgi:hypothetical protein
MAPILPILKGLAKATIRWIPLAKTTAQLAGAVKTAHDAPPKPEGRGEQASETRK